NTGCSAAGKRLPRPGPTTPCRTGAGWRDSIPSNGACAACSSLGEMAADAVIRPAHLVSFVVLAQAPVGGDLCRVDIAARVVEVDDHGIEAHMTRTDAVVLQAHAELAVFAAPGHTLVEAVDGQCVAFPDRSI